MFKRVCVPRIPGKAHFTPLRVKLYVQQYRPKRVDLIIDPERLGPEISCLPIFKPMNERKLDRHFDTQILQARHEETPLICADRAWCLERRARNREDFRRPSLQGWFPSKCKSMCCTLLPKLFDSLLSTLYSQNIIRPISPGGNEARTTLKPKPMLGQGGSVPIPLHSTREQGLRISTDGTFLAICQVGVGISMPLPPTA